MLFYCLSHRDERFINKDEKDWYMGMENGNMGNISKRYADHITEKGGPKKYLELMEEGIKDYYGESWKAEYYRQLHDIYMDDVQGNKDKDPNYKDPDGEFRGRTQVDDDFDVHIRQMIMGTKYRGLIMFNDEDEEMARSMKKKDEDNWLKSYKRYWCEKYKHTCPVDDPIVYELQKELNEWHGNRYN